MVINIPTSNDFYLSGEELFNFAWDALLRLVKNLDESSYYGIDQEEVSEQYWEGAKRTVSTSLTIIQQGVEFFLKGRIASISPYLLIADPPAKWPSINSEDGQNIQPIDFSKFRTLDAQDLVKVYNTFSPQPLGGEFVERFNKMRERRNAIIHSVTSTDDLNVKQVIESLLFVHNDFFPTVKWAERRKYFLLFSPDAELAEPDWALTATCLEVSLVAKMLQPSETLSLLGINKKLREYFCPKCLAESDQDITFEIKLAHLKSKSPDETNLYCPICNLNHKVLRKECDEKYNSLIESSACPGNVISEEYGQCLTCGQYHEVR